MHQERPQSIYKIDNIIPSILGKQKKHKCEFCNYSSDRKHDVKRHVGIWTERQTGKCTERQTGKWTERQTGKCTDIV